MNKFDYLHLQIALFSAILLLLPYIASAQCSDSISNELLISNRFVDMDGTILTPVVAGDDAVSYGSVGRLDILVKKNKEGNNQWVKNIKYFRPQFFDRDGNVIGIFDIDDSYIGGGGSGGIAKLNIAGDVMWAKKPGFATGTYSLGTASVTEGINEDIILYNRDSKKEISIYIFDKDLTQLKLQKHFKFDPPSSRDEDISSFKVARLGHALYISAIVSDAPQWEVAEGNSYILLIKVNYLSGDIEKTRYLRADDVFYSLLPNGYPVTLRGSFSSEFNYKAINNNLLLMAGRKTSTFEDNNRLYGIAIDSNLSILGYKLYMLPNSHTYFHSQQRQAVPFINNNGNILYALTQDSIMNPSETSGCYYFLAGSDLKILSQRFLTNSDIGGALHHYVTATPLLKDNNDIQVIFQSRSVEQMTPINFINIPHHYDRLPCRGSDADFLAVEDGSFSTMPTPYIERRPPVAIDIVSSSELKSEPGNLESERYCVQKNVCDEIQIISNKAFCVAGDSAVFTLRKNSGCLYKTQWTTDSDFIKVTEKNDTTLKLYFLKPFSGYIKAGFENCNLADSVYVTVYPVPEKFSLGNDFTLCPDSQYVLRVPFGYNDYLWQGKIHSDSFTISKPGAYSLTATDYCGRKYHSSIKVYSLNTDFLPSSRSEICKFDTLNLSLDPNFNHYSWIPANASHREEMMIKFFPEKSTLYTVSAEAFTGCVVSAKLNVIVKDCPKNITFPNAFSPNSDGLNDVFSPVTEGNIQSFFLKIYNRYGQIIFQSDNPQKGWNGYFKGEPQPSGNYVWQCEYSFKGEDKKRLKGTLILIR